MGNWNHSPSGVRRSPTHSKWGNGSGGRSAGHCAVRALCRRGESAGRAACACTRAPCPRVCGAPEAAQPPPTAPPGLESGLRTEAPRGWPRRGGSRQGGTPSHAKGRRAPCRRRRAATTACLAPPPAGSALPPMSEVRLDVPTGVRACAQRSACEQRVCALAARPLLPAPDRLCRAALLRVVRAHGLTLHMALRCCQP